MNTLSFAKIAIATLGLLVLTGASHATENSKPSAATQAECMTDDGYGRKRPFAAGIQQKQAEQNPNECRTAGQILFRCAV
jgi:hypothetical protein